MNEAPENLQLVWQWVEKAEHDLKNAEEAVAIAQRVRETVRSFLAAVGT